MAAESCMSRSPGHCMTMGTASTMASMVEALGVTLPGNAAIPGGRLRAAMRLARDDGPAHRRHGAKTCACRKLLVRDAFANAVRINGAIGGSTNAVLHLLAIAGRVHRPAPADARRLGPWAATCRPWST
jgi:L-arabonate dehydrase